MSSQTRNEDSDFIPEPIPEIGEEREMWVAGLFKVRCIAHNDDATAHVLLLPGQYRNAAQHDGDSWQVMD
jgi:hypothetical protein